MFSWQDLDLNQPVNWAHPLNRGRSAWWLTVPQRYGAPVWWDLVAGRPGSLNSFPSGYGWSSQSNPGGAGSIHFDGANGYVAISDAPSLRPTSLTVGAWAYFVSWNTANSVIVCKPLTATGGATWTAPYLSYLLRVDGASGTIGEFSASPGNTYTAASLSYSFALRTWYRFYGTYDGSNVSLYVFSGGKLVASKSTAASGAITYNSTPLYIGTDAGGATDGYDRSNCFINDVFVANRAWSVGEMTADYWLSQQGYPDVLNWRKADFIDLLVVPANPGSMVPKPFVSRPRFEPAFFE